MMDNAADKPSESKIEDEPAAAEHDLIFPDENENISVRKHGAQQQQTTPPPAEKEQKFSSPVDIDDMEGLLDEGRTEEEILGMPSYGGVNGTKPASEPAFPDTPAYDPTANSAAGMGSMENMVDLESAGSAQSTTQEKSKEESEFMDIFDASNDSPSLEGGMEDRFDDLHEDPLDSGKRIQLTEDDYADRFFPGRDDTSSYHTDTEEDDHGAQAASNGASAEDSGPAPSSLGALKSRTNIGILLGLLGVIGSAVALWLTLGISDQVAHLETQRSVKAPVVKTADQSAAIASLNRRLDKLSGQFAEHMKQVAESQARPAPAAPEAQIASAKPVATSAVAVKPASKPAVKKQAVSKPASPAAVPVKPAMAKQKVPTPAKASPAAKPVLAAQPSKRGEWVVNLSSFGAPAAAASELARLKKLGVQAESIKVVVHGRTWFRLRVPGYASEKVAREQLKVLEKQVGIKDAWIGVR